MADYKVLRKAQIAGAIRQEGEILYNYDGKTNGNLELITTEKKDITEKTAVKKPSPPKIQIQTQK